MYIFQILNRLLAITREDDNWFKKFTRKGDLFRVFNLLLKDNRWEVQHQCIKFIVETMHQYGPVSNELMDADACVTISGPRMVHVNIVDRFGAQIG